MFDLILRLKTLALAQDLTLHVIHVSGTRMKAQGTDGLSRGNKGIGVMSGMSMLSFVPLHLSPYEREPLVKRFVEAVVQDMSFNDLTPEGWYTASLEEGNYILNIPPTAGDVVYELVDKARIRHPESMHFVLIPRLLTGMWRRLMTKRTGVYLKIDWPQVWPLCIHYEPLLIFICFPFSINKRFSERLYTLHQEFQGVLQKARVQQVPYLQKRISLR